MLTLCGQRFVSVCFPCSVQYLEQCLPMAVLNICEMNEEITRLGGEGFSIYKNLLIFRSWLRKGQVAISERIPDTNTLNPRAIPFALCLSAATLSVGWLVTQDPGMSFHLFPSESFHQGSCMIRKEREGGVALCNCPVPRWIHSHRCSAFRRPGGLHPQ